MNYIVIDLEFNGRRHYDIYPMEIIELGAVKLNEKLEIIDMFQSYIKPKYPINRFALEFCGIQEKTLKEAEPFTQVIDRFRRFCGEEFIVFAWGCSDFFSLFVDCRVNEIDNDWLTQRLVDMSKPFEGGLQQALATHELPSLGQHHSALDDALNAVQLLKLKPEIVQHTHYYRPDPMKLVTGGIKKWILMSLDKAAAEGHVLRWEEFVSNGQTLAYSRIMHLTEQELQMVKVLFIKYFKQKYGRKVKLQPV
ncbi:3'-5' exonuclease [Paenibacillus silviterrae]|uniref:3'-5' exonuclease n=1 Tax=Paenibacillus silviterrae TaxID=3242194 RepID=UPI002543540B|nr:3'-5' exonuclease [Paenibacillus chinjuensis]